MQKIFKFLMPALVTALTACGGGGGSPGETSESYTITLRAERTVLPVNVGGYPAGIGVYAPFTTILYVNANKGGAPIPGGDDVFACNTAYGLGSGPLYYLDGDDEHEDDNGNPLAYRSVTLGANSGGNSFHFHAGDQAGTATITCSVQDPRSNTPVSASVNITVGAPTGQAASIRTIPFGSDLGTKGNTNGVPTSIVIQALVLDDANQPLPSSGKTNLQVSIRPVGAAAVGARLLSGSLSGGTLQVQTVGGVGTFNLASGPSEGSILLELVADRRDNDLTNGIQDPIEHLVSVPVTRGDTVTAPIPVVLAGDAPPTATNGLPYSFAFSASGGKPPFIWTALGALPDGLTLSSSGILSGVPNVRIPGDVQVAVRVTDSVGSTATGNFTLTVDGTPGADPTTTPLTINLAGCSTDVNTICALPNWEIGQPYQLALTATGTGAGAVAWAFEVAPAGLGLNISTNGVLNGATLAPRACGVTPFFIRATKNNVTTIRRVSIAVVAGTAAGTACVP